MIDQYNTARRGDDLRSNRNRVNGKLAEPKDPVLLNAIRNPVNSDELWERFREYGFEKTGVRGADTYIKTRTVH
jgi:hypothetical protein